MIFFLRFINKLYLLINLDYIHWYLISKKLETIVIKSWVNLKSILINKIVKYHTLNYYIENQKIKFTSAVICPMKVFVKITALFLNL